MKGVCCICGEPASSVRSKVCSEGCQLAVQRERQRRYREKRPEMFARRSPVCVVCGAPAKLRSTSCSEVCRLAVQRKNQRQYRERNPDLVRERHAQEMRDLRAAQRAGLKLKKTRAPDIECKCVGCGKSFFVARASQARVRQWCSSSCSNRRLVGKETERFLDRVDRRGGADACWPWTGARHVKDGRGRFSVNNGTQYASRYMWKLVHGELADDIGVLHKCDNPPCCNPQHLFLGTQQDNATDRETKGRGRRGIPPLGPLRDRGRGLLTRLVKEPSCWVTPMALGGEGGSHHSATLRALCKRGLVEKKKRAGSVRPSLLYRITEAGRQVLEET